MGSRDINDAARSNPLMLQLRNERAVILMTLKCRRRREESQIESGEKLEPRHLGSYKQR